MNVTEIEVRKMRKDKGIIATFKLVDTCAAEFEAYTPYFYSTYESEDEAIIQIEKFHLVLRLLTYDFEIVQGLRSDKDPHWIFGFTALFFTCF